LHATTHGGNPSVLLLRDAELGLEVIASVGTRRFAGHRSVPEIHRELSARGDDRPCPAGGRMGGLSGRGGEGPTGWRPAFDMGVAWVTCSCHVRLRRVFHIATNNMVGEEIRKARPAVIVGSNSLGGGAQRGAGPRVALRVVVPFTF